MIPIINNKKNGMRTCLKNYCGLLEEKLIKEKEKCKDMEWKCYKRIFG